ncbi:MAG TPA: hypothetical protein GX507_04300 [Clostridia bacterium]|nr:hypothetical protein [Clostridia bacterium]
MKVAVPKEIKKDENRVAITPAGVAAFVKRGHRVFIEKDAEGDVRTCPACTAADCEAAPAGIRRAPFVQILFGGPLKRAFQIICGSAI